MNGFDDASPAGGPPPSSPFGWVPPPPLSPPPPPPGADWRRIASVGVSIAVLVVVVLVVIGQTTGKRAHARTDTLPSSVSAGLGRVLYSDNFDDPGSGWTTQTLSSGTTFAYTPKGYRISGHGSLHHFSSAPFGLPLSQVQVSMTATQSGGAARGSGFGVACRRPPSEVRASTLNRYEFLVDTGNRFYIERRDGLLSTSSAPFLLRTGTAPASPGPVAVTVDALCSTLPDGRSTRLALFINGDKVADLVDVAAGGTSAGWLASIEVSTQATAPSTVTVSHFEERDPTMPSS